MKDMKDIELDELVEVTVKTASLMYRSGGEDALEMFLKTVLTSFLESVAAGLKEARESEQELPY